MPVVIDNFEICFLKLYTVSTSLILLVKTVYFFNLLIYKTNYSTLNKPKP